MADNFLERQHEDYLRRKAQADKARRLKWQKQLKAYKEKLAKEAAEGKSLLILLALLTCGFTALAGTVAEEGAWCWFADPRALHYDSADSLINMTYVGYIDTHGNIKAMQYDFQKGCATEVLVRSYFQPDDHDNPTFLALPDGRIMVFYSRHTDEPCFYYRISRLHGDITTLGEEHIIKTEHNTTYPSPFILTDDPEHFYLCWRGINWHPTIARLTLPDAEGRVSIDLGPYQIVQSTGARPYCKYYSDGKSKIGMAYTTGHPDNESPNYLYYNYIDISDLSLCDVGGTKVSDITTGPWHVDKTADFVQEHPVSVVDASPYRDWVWSLAYDGPDPVIAMTRISGDKHSHNYYVARWDGMHWVLNYVAHGGGHFHQSPKIEHCYSGGMALNAAQPSDVYCSVPVTGAHGKIYEIVKYTLDGNGEVITAEAITSNSEKSCVRPYVIDAPQGAPLRLLWMQGDYYDWIVSRDRHQGYCTSVMCDFDGFDCSSATDTLSLVWNYDESGPLPFSLAGYEFAYFVDPSTLLPEVIYKGKRYRSTNRMATSDSWADAPRATDGRWHAPVRLEDPKVTFEVTDTCLRTYINGRLDQCIDIK